MSRQRRRSTRQSARTEASTSTSNSLEEELEASELELDVDGTQVLDAFQAAEPHDEPEGPPDWAAEVDDEVMHEEIEESKKQRKARKKQAKADNKLQKKVDRRQDKSDKRRASLGKRDRKARAKQQRRAESREVATEEDPRKLKRGTELTEHRAATPAAHEDFVELMHQDDGGRAASIYQLLHHSRGGGRNQLFYALQMRLSGDNAALAAEYAQQYGQDLEVDIMQALTNVHQKEYLRSTLNAGEPRMEDRILLALGLVTTTACDKKEVLHLFENVADDLQRRRVWHFIGHVIVNVMGEKAGDRMRQQVESLQLVDDLEFLRIAQPDDDVDQLMLEQKDREITALAMTCRGKLGLKREKLAEVLPAWAARHDQATRDWVTQPGSDFYSFIETLKGKKFAKVQKTFKTADMRYTLRMVRDASPVDDAFFQDGVHTEDLQGDALDERQTARAEAGADHVEFAAYLERKETTTSVFKGSDAYESLQDRIDGLSDQAKDAFIQSYLPPTEQDEFGDADTPHARRMELRSKAIDEGFNEQLKSIGMRSIMGRSGGDLTAMRHRFVDAFAYGAADHTTHAGSTYQRLVDHSHGKVVRNTKFGQQTLALCRKLRGDEFAQVRGDVDLMARLRDKTTGKYRGQLDQILGVSNGEHDGAEGQAVQDVLNDTGDGEQLVRSLGDARQVAANEAELKPSHWAVKLGAALKFSDLKKRTEVNSLVTRAYMAGQRRERMTSGGPAHLSGTLKLAPMGAGDFVRNVHASMSKGALDALSKSSYKTARLALQTGTRPDVDEQIDDALFRNAAKRTRGGDLPMSRVVQMVQDLEGRDLLEEWSNIEAFDALVTAKQVADAEGSADDARELQGELDTFTLQIRHDRQVQMKDLLPPKDFKKVVTTVQSKLYAAMRDDEQARAALEESGIVNDEIAQANTRSLGLLDDQRQRSTGAQYNTYNSRMALSNPLSGKTLIGASAASAEAKESAGTLLGRTRAAHSELRTGADRETVAAERHEGLVEAQDDQVRRGDGFDEMQNKFNALAKSVIKTFLRGVMLAAWAAVTAATGGVGGALAVAWMGAKTLVSELTIKALQARLEGDDFNVTEAVFDVAIQTLIGTGAGVVGELVSPIVADGMGAPTHDAEGVGGGRAIGSETGEMTLGQAAAAGFAKNMKRTTKSLLKQAAQQLRAEGGRSGERTADIGNTLVGITAQMGLSIGAEVAEALEAQTENDPDATRGEQRGATALAGAAGGAQFAAKRLAPLLPDLFEVDEHVMGADHTSKIKQRVEAVLAEAEQRIEQLDGQIDDRMASGDIDVLSELSDDRADLHRAYQQLQQALADYTSNKDTASSQDTRALQEAMWRPMHAVVTELERVA